MITTTTLLAVLALAVTPMRSASEAATQGPTQEDPTAQDPTAQDPTMQQGKEMKTQDDKTTAQVRGHIVPVLAGIEMSEVAAGALYQLTNAETPARGDAKDVVAIAEHALKTAREGTKSLANVKELSETAKTETNTVKDQLKEVNATMQSIKKAMAGGEKQFKEDGAKKVQQAAMKLDGQLAEVSDSIERVAEEYGISSDLEVPDTAAIRTQR